MQAEKCRYFKARIQLSTQRFVKLLLPVISISSFLTIFRSNQINISLHLQKFFNIFHEIQFTFPSSKVHLIQYSIQIFNSTINKIPPTAIPKTNIKKSQAKQIKNLLESHSRKVHRSFFISLKCCCFLHLCAYL